MDHPSISVRDTTPETAATTRPSETAPEVGPALRLLVLAIAAALRRGLWRSGTLAAAILRRAPQAVIIAWRTLRAGAARATTLFWSVAAVAGRVRRSMLRLPPPTEPTRQRLRGFMIGMVGAMTLVLIGGGGYLAYCAYTLPLSGGLATQPKPPAIVVEDNSGKAFATRGVFRGERVAVDQLPANLVHAVLAIEDRRFFEHSGIDFSGILRAALRDLRSGTPREGGSTITQQLVRLTYLSPERTIRRKVQEAMLAVWLETRLSKQEILTRYLNGA